MSFSKLIQFVALSMRRNRRDLILSSVGIIVGIGTLFFFTALGEGIRRVVLEEIFVVNQLEVVQKTYDVGGIRTGGLFGQRKLTDNTVEDLKKIPGVKNVYPKMHFTFPTSAQGGKRFLGTDMVAELIADGIPSELVADQTFDDLDFRDWEAPISCTDDTQCPDGHTCSTHQTCKPRSCLPGRAQDTVCEGISYCHETLSQCTLPIPVIASPMLLEVYNSNLHTAIKGSQGAISKLPKLSEQALIGLEIEANFGRSFIGRSQLDDSIRYRLRLVGFSDKAIRIGVTMPIEYVQRLNTRFSGTNAGKEFHAIIVETESNDVVAQVAHRITEDMGLSLSDRFVYAQRAGLLILLITLIFNLIAFIILAISAINIMHTFLMLIMERRKEFGILRALGARKSDIRFIVLLESIILGLLGGFMGALSGFFMIHMIDRAFRDLVPAFPFKPDTLFMIHSWYWPTAILIACIFCAMGALLPALKASRIDPSKTLIS